MYITKISYICINQSKKNQLMKTKKPISLKTKKNITDLRFYLHLLSTHIEDLNFSIIWHDHTNENSQFYIERLKNLINDNDLNEFTNTDNNE